MIQSSIAFTMSSTSNTGNFGDISPFGIYSGQFIESVQESIINILARELDCEVSPMGIKTQVEDCHHAVLKHRTTKEVYTNLDKRNCKRYTFDSTIVDELSSIILPVLSTKSHLLEPEDIRLDPTHGDILLYEEGGVFQWHRDEVLECPFEDPERWTFNSMILCLDSYGGYGSTMVDCPSNKYLTWSFYPELREKYSLENDHEIVNCMQTISPCCYAVFPANLKHKSNMVMPSTNGVNFKLALKLDVWMKAPKYSPKIESIFDFTKKTWSDVAGRVPSTYKPPVPHKPQYYYASKPSYKYYDEDYAYNKSFEDEWDYYDYDDYANEIDECNGYCD